LLKSCPKSNKSPNLVTLVMMVDHLQIIKSTLEDKDKMLRSFLGTFSTLKVQCKLVDKKKYIILSKDINDLLNLSVLLTEQDQNLSWFFGQII